MGLAQRASGSDRAGAGRAPRRLPPHGWLGLALVAIVWPLNWGLEGLRTHVLFFPLWLGYALSIDGLCARRTGTSIATRSPRSFALLFLVSTPLWWLFELFNLRLGNWEYVARNEFTDLEYAFWASLSFSTVVPAVLGTAELAASAGWIRRMPAGPVVRPGPRLARAAALAGALMLAAMLAWPRQCFPFVWMWMVFALEALAIALGRPVLTAPLARGDWRPWLALWIGGLVCGFFWELWNFWSHPKWIYHVPYVGFGHVFEMPILGYLGYLPFAHEVWLVARLARPRDPALPFVDRESTP